MPVIAGIGASGSDLRTGTPSTGTLTIEPLGMKSTPVAWKYNRNVPDAIEVRLEARGSTVLVPIKADPNALEQGIRLHGAVALPVYGVLALSLGLLFLGTLQLRGVLRRREGKSGMPSTVSGDPTV